MPLIAGVLLQDCSRISAHSYEEGEAGWGVEYVLKYTLFGRFIFLGRTHMPGNELSGDDDGLFLLRSDSLGLRRKRPSAFVEPLGRMGEFLNI